MGKRWRPGGGWQQECPVHGKSIYTSEGSALSAAQGVETAQRLERGAMSHYWCAESRGWHIGHRSIRDRLRGND